MSKHVTSAILAGALLLASAASPAVASPAHGDGPVPGADRVAASRLDDLTTAGTVDSGHTDPAAWAGLNAEGTHNPSGVPGVQLDGHFPDRSTTNATHGWDHDSQFVIRFPEDWNGGLVVGGSPGNRTQYALDAAVSDWVVAQGYAFAATDKGNTGLEFHRDGRRPGDAVAEWNERLTQLTVAAQKAADLHYGRSPERTFVTGLSNGGYLTRWQLENRPDLYDGGIDWSGVLWRGDGPNLFTTLPTAVREYPAYAGTGDPQAREALVEAGFPADSEFLWEYHHEVYWGLTQEIYRTEFDPAYKGDDADYAYGDRPASVRRAVERISLTGDIGKPLITLHGTLDALLPISTDSDVYADMVDDRGNADIARYYRVEDGNHVDGLYDRFPDRLRPMLPCYREAFTAMERWVDDGTPPPPSTTVERPEEGDLVNRCAL
ncbi:tannase/feruloyl esterase family alpha/beta hydrolase [Nocardiopsis sp. RSe5-2]|uniref:Tannase/feruloyl esterase family alpha/beta hydrolase n=1 Tax=Nocardiopsis endophytica TaxID=3018445 RepID=A0ABT4U244_9ACTN|nr:tannase/feruloyl esterase family alpha/beta hydrolase [Nocardiopsis endophytica]MDA2810998.1 tannase/feruloyl esterase family alpha/beta hydrolase [Nocardiopsis endophytica]